MPSVRLLRESIGTLTKTSSTVVSLAPSMITIGGQQYSTATLYCNIGVLGYSGLEAAVQGWKLYYVYAVVYQGSVVLVGSTSSSGPTGITAYKLVGYFDTTGIVLGSTTINGASNSVQGSVGDIKAAHMTEAQFVAANGPGWILADGRSVSGSAWATLASLSSAPDARGVALRGKNNGRSSAAGDADGERLLGSSQGDSFGSHNHGGGDHKHVVNSHNHGGGSHKHTWKGYNNTDGSGTGEQHRSRYEISGDPEEDATRMSGNILDSESPGTGGPTNDVGAGITIIAPNGGNETRMRNIAVNYFIKVN